MYKRLIVATLIVLSLSFSVGAEEIAKPKKESHDFVDLNSIGNALDTLKNVLLTAAVEVSADAATEYVSKDGEISSYIDKETDPVPPSKIVDDPSPIVSDEPELYTSPDVEPSHIHEHEPASSHDVEPTPISGPEPFNSTDVEPSPIPEPEPATSPDVEPTPIPESEPVNSPDIVPASVTDPAPIPPVFSKEFRIMCESADAIIIRNAIENRNADVNYADAYGVTPLMSAAKSNPSPEIIAILVESGADINAHDQGGKTPLMYAAESNPNPEIVAALIANGARVNSRDNRRRTALMFAARMNNPAVVKALIDAGSEEVADEQGWTPLFWAARYTQYPEVIAVLLDAGHNPKARSYDMARPIEHANLNPNLMNSKALTRLSEESR